MSLRLRRGTDTERQAVTFLEGELVYTTDTKKVFVGDGSTLGGVAIDSALGSIGTLTDVDISGVAIGQTLQWDGVKFIPGNADQESLYGTDSTILVDAINSSINLDGTVKGHIVPDSNIAYDLGSAAARFRDLYLSGSSIDLGGTTISTAGGKVNFSAPVQAEFELNQNMDLKNYYITSTDATPDISVRPGTNSDFHVATVAGTKLFEVDLATNTYGTPAGEKTVLQLPVFGSADYTAHTGEALGQIVFDNPSKTLKIYNGTDWVTVQGTGGAGGGIVEGTTYDINISGNVVGSDSSFIVNTDLNTFTGDLTGSVFSQGSTELVDAVNGLIVGDISSDVGTFTGTVTANEFTSAFGTITDLTATDFYTGSITATGTTTLNTVTASSVSAGAFIGSLFSEDSTEIIDANANTISTDTLTATNRVNTNRIEFERILPKTDSVGIFLESTDEIARMMLRRVSAGAINDSTTIGRIVFGKDQGGTQTGEFTVSATTDQFVVLPSPAGVFDYNNYFKVSKDGKVAISMDGEISNAPTDHLEVGGNGSFTGTITAASFKGSVVADDSTEIVDAVNSKVSATIVATAGTAPSLAGDPGDTGEIRFDDSFIYIKTPSGDWKKVALASLV